MRLEESGVITRCDATPRGQTRAAGAAHSHTFAAVRMTVYLFLLGLMNKALIPQWTGPLMLVHNSKSKLDMGCSGGILLVSNGVWAQQLK